MTQKDRIALIEASDELDASAEQWRERQRDPDGMVQDARAAARDVPDRDALRTAVRHARWCAGAANADDSLRHWGALVAGRWSLIDRFDSDGRRYVVAVRNDRRLPDRRRLTPRERQIADLVGLGSSPKQIAYTLGVCASAVSNRVLRLQEKLGLGSLAEIAAFFAATGLRVRLVEIALRGENLLVGTYPLADARAISGLSEAERQVAGLLVSGATNADIAQRRGTSERTVANQVQSIFRKLGARSRAELAIRLQAGR